MTERGKATAVLTMNTLAFTACFAVWTMNGVLVAFLVENKLFTLDKVQIGWLLGLPVLTGSLVRLPVGLLTDRYGGRAVYPVVMLLAALGSVYLSFAQTYGELLAGSLAFGLAGTGFAVGIAYTSVWFKKERQGTALGIFGVGNAGASITSFLGPVILAKLTAGGANPDAWRTFPRLYAAGLVVMAVVFVFLTYTRKVAHGGQKSLAQQLAPLRKVRVWRFGLYYFLVFGLWVGLSQWLIFYYMNVYGLSLAVAGTLATVFSLPGGVIRALGGWMSDRMGARTTMYWVLGACAVSALFLAVPRMDITSPGEGVNATGKGVVTAVSEREVVVGDSRYPVKARPAPEVGGEGALILPRSENWQEPVVTVGETIKKKQLLARGVTHIYFQANIWVFTGLVFVLGIMMGIGKAAVYKYIPEYFPQDIGVVGGLVGVIGGLGGFFGPMIFGYLLRATGLWTTCWMFILVLSVVCLAWMHLVVRRMMRKEAPALVEKFEDGAAAVGAGDVAAAGGGPRRALPDGGAARARSRPSVMHLVVRRMMRKEAPALVEKFEDGAAAVGAREVRKAAASAPATALAAGMAVQS